MFTSHEQQPEVTDENTSRSLETLTVQACCKDTVTVHFTTVHLQSLMHLTTVFMTPVML